MAKPSTLQKIKGQVPKDTKQPILEDSSESKDSDTETIVTDYVAKPAEVFSADKMALEIIEEMIKIVFEAEQENVSDHIISNDLLRQNVENIHKQRFVKIKLNEQKNEPMPSFAKKLPVTIEPSRTTDSKSFRQVLQQRGGTGLILDSNPG